MRKLGFLVALLLMGLYAPVFAQEDTLPEYDQARAWTPDKSEHKMFSLSIHPNYIKGTTKFWYNFKTTAGENWYIVDPETRSKRTLFNASQLASQLTEQSGNSYTADQLDLKGMKLKDDGVTFEFTLDSVKYEYQYQSQKLSKIGKDKPERKATWGNVSPDGKWVAYGKDYNLFLMSKADYEKLQANPKDSVVTEIQLSTTGIKDFSFAQQSRKTVSKGEEPKEEKGRRVSANGYWSPDSKYFIQIIQDTRKIKNLWVINSVTDPRPTLETYKYQMPGEEGADSHLYVFDIAKRSMKEVGLGNWKNQMVRIYNGKLSTGNPFDPDEVRTWKGQDGWFYLMRMSRDFKHMDVCTYTLGQDSIVPILRENQKNYLDSRSIVLLEKGNKFIQWSERDGWAHLYLYDKSGKLLNRITSGDWHVESVMGVDETKKVIYFMANGREKTDSTPYYEHLYRVNYDGTGLTTLSPGDYFHNCFMDEKNAYIVDNYSRINTVPSIDLYDVTGHKIMELEKADMSQLFASGYKFPEMFKVKADDGVTDLYGIMYKPYDFDSTKVYPVIDYVYPGPQTEGPYWRFNRISPRTDRLAQAGFIVISVGQRGGHPSRSKWYHDFGYGNLRDYPLADHKTAIEQLCAQNKFMDITKVGITGHSGGGFMSTAAILTYPDFFKVAVSCSGNHDNNVYNTTWSEKYHGVTMRMDEEGRTHFDIHIPANQELVSRLKGNLLLIHGDIDDNVHPANTIRMVNALIKAGKRFDMLIMPEKRHQYDQFNEYFYWRMVDYFSEHLKGKSEHSVDIKDMKLGNWSRGAQEAI